MSGCSNFVTCFLSSTTSTHLNLHLRCIQVATARRACHFRLWKYPELARTWVWLTAFCLSPGKRVQFHLSPVTAAVDYSSFRRDWRLWNASVLRRPGSLGLFGLHTHSLLCKIPDSWFGCKALRSLEGL